MLFKLAWRNVWRRPGRMVMWMLVIALGSAFLLLGIAVRDAVVAASLADADRVAVVGAPTLDVALALAAVLLCCCLAFGSYHVAGLSLLGRTYEIATLQQLGMPPGHLRGIAALEATFGLGVGLGLGVLAAWGLVALGQAPASPWATLPPWLADTPIHFGTRNVWLGLALLAATLGLAILPPVYRASHPVQLGD